MDIKSALEPDNKAFIVDEKLDYAYEDDEGILRWNSDHSVVELDVVLAAIWTSYHEKPEIRPENAGELWKRHGLYYHTEFKGVADGTGMRLVGFHGAHQFDDDLDPIHGKNGWTRLKPSVPDENVTSIEIDCAENWKHIECFTSLNKCRYEVTISNVMNKALTDKAPMKMTLTREKDKKEKL